MDQKIEVRISSRFPVFIEADCDSFGAVFSAMTDEEQVQVLRSMVQHMKPHQTQWDHISIALEQPENRELRDTLREMIFPVSIAAAPETAAERDRLRDINANLLAALKALAGPMEAIRDDQASLGIRFGSTPAARAERARILIDWIKANADTVDDALEMASTAIAKAEGGAA